VSSVEPYLRAVGSYIDTGLLAGITAVGSMGPANVSCALYVWPARRSSYPRLCSPACTPQRIAGVVPPLETTGDVPVTVVTRSVSAAILREY